MEVAIRRAIIVCALGYFIDIFDIQLFAVLRVPSLTELGVLPDRIPVVGGYILNIQMLGMVMGAFLWGYLGDRAGRLKALYGSILIYSVGTLACSLVHQPVAYGACRFIAGFGLAGETGAAVTLISELMSREKRGWGATIIGGFGAFGPVAAVLISWILPWRQTYVVAGLLGLVLLALRLRLVEPALFQKISRSDPRRGSLKLFAQRRRAVTLLCAIAIGVPSIYCVNLLNFYSLELGRSVLLPGQVFSQKLCLLCFYVGLGCGNTANGALSQLWRNRRKALAAFMLFNLAIVAVYLLAGPVVKFSATQIYLINFALGFHGALILAVIIATEHFGTNIRATSAILISNLLRGGIIPMVFAFQWLRLFLTIGEAAALVGCVVYALAFLALRQLRETYGIDLDYVELTGEESLPE